MPVVAHAKDPSNSTFSIQPDQSVVVDFLSDDQAVVLRSVVNWLNSLKDKTFTLGGYAGTGKSTLIGVLRKLIQHTHPKKKIAFACFTGRASENLRQKLVQSDAEYIQDYCGTIHRLMYQVIVDDTGAIIGQKKQNKLDYDLIIIDEASMVSREMWMDLCSYGIPILAVGDHGQLPPIGSQFNLMDKPQVRLEKVHRQAADNPIIKLAQHAREGTPFEMGRLSSKVQVIPNQTPESWDIMERIFSTFSSDTLILCGTNRNRVRLNHTVRNHLGRETPEPIVGDRVVCLKNIYENEGGDIYNGMIGTITAIRPEGEHWYDLEVEFLDENKIYSGKVAKSQFGAAKTITQIPGIHYSKIGDLFDFGYAVTVHKAQGTQAKRVLVFDESHVFERMSGAEEAKKWLYTAVTRAEEELYVVK